MASPNKPLHVVMLPWLAFGHIIPYFDLAKHLAFKGHLISFLSTPRNISRLPPLPPHLSSFISLVPLPFPHPLPSGLSPSAEATMDIHGPSQMSLLKKAFDSLQPSVARFLHDQDPYPDWIIVDFAPHWLPPITAPLGISTAFFFIINAWFLAFFGSADDLVSGSDYRTRPEDFMVPPRWVKFDTKAAYRRYEANWILGTAQGGESGYSDLYRGGKVLKGCDVIVVRHCYEFEPEWLPLLEELHKKPVVPLGLMPPKTMEMRGDKNENEEEEEDGVWITVKKWLGGKEKGSVVYVALGSEVTLSGKELSELAHGLELANVPFFWVLRKPGGGEAEEEEEEEGLPGGFEERVEGRGMVWRSWVPQMKILSHEAVGGFLTHCGWSSIVEGVACGHPLITLPFLVDQGLNSRIIVDKGLGVEVQRNDDDGTYTRESVAEAVKQVMMMAPPGTETGGTGKELREKVREMSKIFSDRELHTEYIDKFVDYLVEHK